MPSEREMKAFGGLLVTTTAVSPPIESNTLVSG
ncbi:hypothetical protein L917_14764, partial [Phytophthora nicotianae]